LSASAKSAFDTAASHRRKIVLSVISLAEVVYLVEKGRLPASAYSDLRKALHDPDHVLQEAPVTSEIIDAMLSFQRHWYYRLAQGESRPSRSSTFSCHSGAESITADSYTS
jgi:PIN domain nuclease of toxin-antitoxin system